MIDHKYQKRSTHDEEDVWVAFFKNENAPTKGKFKYIKRGDVDPPVTLPNGIKEEVPLLGKEGGFYIFRTSNDGSILPCGIKIINKSEGGRIRVFMNPIQKKNSELEFTMTFTDEGGFTPSEVTIEVGDP